MCVCVEDPNYALYDFVCSKSSSGEALYVLSMTCIALKEVLSSSSHVSDEVLQQLVCGHVSATVMFGIFGFQVTVC